jgi:ribosome-associated protein
MSPCCLDTVQTIPKKGKPLRTDTSRKATKAPSPAEIAAIAPVSQALNTILATLDDAKAEEIVTIDIQGKSALADHMVIASGRSNRHVSAVSDQIISALKDAGFGAPKVEGLEGADWVLLDCGDVIVHVFRPEVRTFYILEKMWTAPDMGEKSVGDQTRH